MSMTKCSECGENISSQARTCPHCGLPRVKPTKGDNEVEVVGFDLTIGEYALEMFKVAVASIPAAILFSFVMFVFISFLTAVVGGLGSVAVGP